MTFDVVEIYVWLLWLSIVIAGLFLVSGYISRNKARAKQMAAEAEDAQFRHARYPYYADDAERIEKSDSGNLL